MTLEQIVEWLKQFLPDGCGIAAGHIDGNADKFVGVYNARRPGKQRICLGGAANTKYQEKKISILIHYTDDAVEAEAAAQALWNHLYGKTRIDMGDTRVQFIDPGAAIVPVGRDARGIAEYVIEATIYHERTES